VITFLKTTAAVLALTMVVLVTVAAMSSSWKAGFRAWSEYMKIMGSMFLIAAAFSGVFILLSKI